MDCGQLQDKINELMNREKRGRAGTKGLLQRFRDYRGDDTTHGPAILDQQASLRSYMDAFDDKGCGDPPNGASELAGRPLPDPVEKPSNSAADAANAVMVVGGGLGLGYLAYRALRMLPSLAPPLWWTIPGNAAVP